MSFEVYKIKSKEDLKNAINFIHKNNFSIKTSIQKISCNFDNRVLGLSIKDNGNIIGNIFYYYQPNFIYNNKSYKVINFATIYVSKSYRGKGIAKLMIEHTLKIFDNYLITDYTPVGSIESLLKKLNFGYMKNNRNLVLPIPNINMSFFNSFMGKLNKITDENKIKNIFKNLDNYRHYEIELWKYENGMDNFIIGLIDRYHKINIPFLNLKFKSKRILWTDNEKLLLKHANNLAFKLSCSDSSYFITIDTKSENRPLFSIKLKNQFMVYPDIKSKISTYGSEFFSNNL